MSYFGTFSRGVRHDCGTALNEASTIMGYWVWSARNFNFSFAISHWWQRAKPRTGMAIMWIAFLFYYTVRNLHFSCDNWREGSASNSLHSALAMAWLFSLFSGPFTDPFVSGVTELFLHVRCIPQQNSQWQFWASGWKLCVKESVWQSCVWKMACDKVVCERWCVTRSRCNAHQWKPCLSSAHGEDGRGTRARCKGRSGSENTMQRHHVTLFHVCSNHNRKQCRWFSFPTVA